MPRSRYSYHQAPNYTMTWWYKILLGLIAAGYLYVNYLQWTKVSADPSVGKLELVLTIVAPLLFVAVMAFGVFTNRLGTYVEITLGHVRWRISGEQGYLFRGKKVAMSRVERIEVKLLEIVFYIRDGTTVVMPLGWFPYEVVQEVKLRFAGVGSLRQVTGGELAKRALQHQN